MMIFYVVVVIVSVIAGLLVGALCGTSLTKRSFEEGKFCPKCGAHYSETELYCTNDGTELLIISGDQ